MRARKSGRILKFIKPFQAEFCEGKGLIIKQIPSKNSFLLTCARPRNLEENIQKLSNTVSDVYKYELLTTNQYLKQMEIIMDIFDELKKLSQIKKNRGHVCEGIHILLVLRTYIIRSARTSTFNSYSGSEI